MDVQVYVDTNVLLDLLATQPVVSDEMSKFLALCENASLHLLLPQQTQDEYLSNREDVVAATIKSLKAASSLGDFPRLLRNHDQGPDLVRLRSETADKIKSVERWYSETAKRNQLPFDLWLSKLRATGSFLKSDDDVLAKAQHRAARHLPPGKGEQLGDRLIWECLLKGSEFCGDLHLITADSRDYRCPLNGDKIRNTLQDEWGIVNWGEVYLYESISDFLAKVSNSEQFQRAAEIGRSIWTLRNQAESKLIDAACSILNDNLKVLSKRQADAIALAAKAYFDRVFITVDSFDRFTADFHRSYAKHLGKKESEGLAPVIAASEQLGYNVAANSN